MARRLDITHRLDLEMTKRELHDLTRIPYPDFADWNIDLEPIKFADSEVQVLSEKE